MRSGRLIPPNSVVWLAVCVWLCNAPVDAALVHNISDCWFEYPMEDASHSQSHWLVPDLLPIIGHFYTPQMDWNLQGSSDRDKALTTAARTLIQEAYLRFTNAVELTIIRKKLIKITDQLDNYKVLASMENLSLGTYLQGRNTPNTFQDDINIYKTQELNILFKRNVSGTSTVSQFFETAVANDENLAVYITPIVCALYVIVAVICILICGYLILTRESMMTKLKAILKDVTDENEKEAATEFTPAPSELPGTNSRLSAGGSEVKSSGSGSIVLNPFKSKRSIKSNFISIPKALTPGKGPGDYKKKSEKERMYEKYVDELKVEERKTKSAMRGAAWMRIVQAYLCVSVLLCLLCTLLIWSEAHYVHGQYSADIHTQVTKEMQNLKNELMKIACKSVDEQYMKVWVNVTGLLRRNLCPQLTLDNQRMYSLGNVFSKKIFRISLAFDRLVNETSDVIDNINYPTSGLLLMSSSTMGVQIIFIFLATLSFYAYKSPNILYSLAIILLLLIALPSFIKLYQPFYSISPGCNLLVNNLENVGDIFSSVYYGNNNSHQNGLAQCEGNSYYTAHEELITHMFHDHDYFDNVLLSCFPKNSPNQTEIMGRIGDAVEANRQLFSGPCRSQTIYKNLIRAACGPDPQGVAFNAIRGTMILAQCSFILLAGLLAIIGYQMHITERALAWQRIKHHIEIF